MLGEPARRERQASRTEQRRAFPSRQAEHGHTSVVSPVAWDSEGSSLHGVNHLSFCYEATEVVSFSVKMMDYI